MRRKAVARRSKAWHSIAWAWNREAMHGFAMEKQRRATFGVATVTQRNVKQCDG